MNQNRVLEAIGKNPGMVNPTGAYCVVELLDTADKSKGGILLTENAQGRKEKVVARVIKHGPGQRNMLTNEPLGMLVKEGDYVLTLKFAPVEINLDAIGKHKLYIIAEGDILGVLERAALDAALAEIEAEEALAEAARQEAEVRAAAVTKELETYEVNGGRAIIEERPSGIVAVTTQVD